jgi:hypothetical protein
MHRHPETTLKQRQKVPLKIKPITITNAFAIAAALLLATALSGCSAVSVAPLPLPAASASEPVTPAPTASTLAAEPTTPVIQEAYEQQLKLVFDYADQLRAMQPKQLANEIARLGSSAMPTDQLRLALVLMQSRAPVEAASARQNGETTPTKPSQEVLLRAQDTVQALIQGTDAESEPLRPFARLLLTRITEQKRIEDLIERQTGQLRDTQRRLEQANEKLQALKEIERSLTRRSNNNQLPTARSRVIQP